MIKPWKLHYEQPSSQDVVDVMEPLSIFEHMNREREQKKKSMKSDCVGKSKYNPALMHCVFWSAAGAERFWSMAGKVLTNERCSLSPLFFELIMYLKYNNRLWTITDVMEANKRRLNESPAAKKWRMPFRKSNYRR